MVLSRLTKITGPGVSTDTNWVGNNADFTGITTTATSFNIGVTTIHSTLAELHNIKSTGIITATGGSFSGNVTAVDGTFSGNVSIAGTLTYEDVTNIDAVGIITAPALDVDDFLDVGSNIKLGNAGVITATSFVGDGSGLIGVASTDNIVTGTAATFTGGVDINSDLDVDGHTNLDNVSIAGVSTFTGGVDINSDLDVDGHTNLDNVSIAGVSTFTGAVNATNAVVGDFIDVGSNIKIGNAGVVTATSFVGSGANLTGISQVGGASSVRFNDDVRAFFGTSSSTDCEIVRNSNAVAGQDSLTVKSDLPFIVSTNNLSNIQFYVNNNSGNNGLIFDNNGLKPSSNNSVKLGSNSYKYNSVYAVNVFATTLFGDGSNLTGITGTTINNNANNRIITGSGTANTLEGESTLTYNGSGTLEINDSGSSVTIRGAGVTKHEMGASASDNDLVFVHNKDQGNITSNIIFKGSGSGGESIKERLRIDSGGRVQIGGVTGPNNAKLFVAGTNSTNYVTIRNTSAADSSGSRWSSVRFQGTQSGGEVSDLVHLQANHEGSADDEKGAFQIQINDGNDGDSLQERMHLYSTNSTSQPIVKFLSSNSGEMLNLQNSSGGGQGMVFGVDTSGSNDTTYLRNNTSSHFDFTFYMGSVSSTYERIRIKQDEFRNSTQFYSNKTAIASNKTITTSYNHMTIGNMTINSGVTVTVNSGARWVIV